MPKENMAFQREKLQTGAELQRQKLLIETNSKDRERHAIALQNGMNLPRLKSKGNVKQLKQKLVEK